MPVPNSLSISRCFIARYRIGLLLGLLLSSAPAATLIPPSDSNILAGLSPLNWVHNSAYICSPVGGASLKTSFKGTSQVILNVDTKNIKTTVASRYPIISWTVNGGAPQSHQLAQNESTVLLAANATDPIIDLYCKGFSPFENRWTGDIPENSVKITGFSVDSGGTTAAVALPSKVWMNIGNSIESGDAAVYATGQGRPPDNLWAASNDARKSYGYLLASHYGYREVRLAYGGWNWGGGISIPGLSPVIDNITSTISRLTSSHFSPIPDIVLINLGENGAPASGDVTASLTKLRSRVNAATKIIVMIPVSGSARSVLTAAFNTYKNAANDLNAYLVDLGSISFATADGQHPTAAGHVSIYNAALPAFNSIIPITKINFESIADRRLKAHSEITFGKASMLYPATFRKSTGSLQLYSFAGKLLQTKNFKESRHVD